MMINSAKLFCLGFSQSVEPFVYSLIAKQCVKDFTLVSACAREPKKCQWLQQNGIDAHLWQNKLDNKFWNAICEADMIIVSAPLQNINGKLIDPFFNIVADRISALTTHSRLSPILVYLSSTNVYGDCNGRWIDEDTPTNPSSARGEGRVISEINWQSLGLRTHIFRLAGIYNFQRNQIRNLQSGNARLIIKYGHVFNRIHGDDITQSLIHAWNKPQPGIYNLADDLPASLQDVLEFAANLCGKALPEAEYFNEIKLAKLTHEFYCDNKRVMNYKLKKWLNNSLKYPNYIFGLTDIWQKMQQHDLTVHNGHKFS